MGAARRREGGKVPIGEIKKVKFWDKKGALELLGRHLRMFADRFQNPNDMPHTDDMDEKTALKILRLANGTRKEEVDPDTKH